jgi:uncharacterized OB-fold protein
LLPGDGTAGDRAAGDGAGVLALVELDEGPWLHTWLIADPAAVVVGMAVVARFEHPAEGESYPVFWPGSLPT